MKKTGIVLGFIGLIIIVLIISIPISNDFVAKNVVKKIEDIPFPERTEYIESAYLAGKLVGNGNGMQYFGAILVKSEQPFEELLNYYESYNDDNWHFIVEKQLKKDIQIIEHGNLSFQTNIKSNDYYIVYSFLAGDEDDDYMNDSDNHHIFAINTVCNYDQDIIPYLHAPAGTAYIRSANGKFEVDDGTKPIVIEKQ